jgi:hypothetical protein
MINETEKNIMTDKFYHCIESAIDIADECEGNNVNTGLLYVEIAKTIGEFLNQNSSKKKERKEPLRVIVSGEIINENHNPHMRGSKYDNL